jgi:hypothetical protein
VKYISKWLNLKNKISIFLSITIPSILFLSQARLDPNAHHDGLMYTSALAVSKGLLPNRDFFTQYGPITPLLHGLIFRYFPAEMLTLRIFNALLLTLTAFTIFKMTRRFCGTSISLLLAVTWTITTPNILPTDLAWPSVLSTLFLLSMLGITTSLDKPWNNQFWVKPACLGLLIALTGLTRIHVFALFPLILVILFIAKKRGGRLVLPFAIGFLATLACVFIAMARLHMLRAYFLQCVVWAFSAYDGNKPDIKAVLVNDLSFLYFPFFCYFVFLVVKSWKSVESTSRRTQQLIYVLFVG